MLSTFRNHKVVKYISSYCKNNGIKLTISKRHKSNYYDGTKHEMRVVDDNKSLSYKLFIISHEYGHAFRDIVNRDKLIDHECNVSVYNSLMQGEKVDSKCKNKLIYSFLLDEYRATTIGLELLKMFNAQPNKATMKLIMHRANKNIIFNYMWMKFRYNIEINDEYDIPNDVFVIPFSRQFNDLIKRIKPIMKKTSTIRNMVESNLLNEEYKG